MKDDDIKDISFKESFRRARQAGLKNFSFGGKKYTTELASAKVPSTPSKPAEKPAEKPAGNPNEVPSNARYKQDTYETPLKSAVRKYGSEAADNLGKIAAGLGVAGGAAYGVNKLANAARAADKGRKEASLVAGNAKLADRMKSIAGGAEKEAASNAAKREIFNASQAKMKSEAGKAAEERLTGLAMNPRRKNIALTEAEKAAEFRHGGKIKKMANGGSASSRADGIAAKGKTKCKVY